MLALGGFPFVFLACSRWLVLVIFSISSQSYEYKGKWSDVFWDDCVVQSFSNGAGVPYSSTLRVVVHEGDRGSGPMTDTRKAPVCNSDTYTYACEHLERETSLTIPVEVVLPCHNIPHTWSKCLLFTMDGGQCEWQNGCVPVCRVIFATSLVECLRHEIAIQEQIESVVCVVLECFCARGYC